MTLNRKDVEIQELKKEVNNWRDKLKDQEHNLHTMKTERNLFFKNLAESKVCLNITIGILNYLLFIPMNSRMKQMR